MSWLPEAFLDEISQILPESEYEAFLESFQVERACGLRFNPLKTDEESFLRQMPFELEKITWAKEGFYYKNEQRPGKHVYHEAGAYYIQEPSAMAVADLLEVKPGEVVLDLCAAPGGKTTQLAVSLQGEGLLVCNEIVPNRAQILSQNVERMGIKNAVVCNEPPERMSQFFPQFFDKMVVDAPCSGEGMFHKNPDAIDEWSKEQVLVCRDRQLFILEHASQMLKSGGTLVYSTCTFNRDEDEGVIRTFLEKHPEFFIDPIEMKDGFSKGQIDGTIRLWPHKVKGEGHFVARMKKVEGPVGTSVKPFVSNVKKETLKDFYTFQNEFLRVKYEGNFMWFKDELYLVPDKMRDLKGLKVIRAGLHLGTNKKNRFEPSHALALALSIDEVKQSLSLTQPERFIKGESVSVPDGVVDMACENIKGWIQLRAGSYPIGWGKASGMTIKNHYPKGLRIM